MAEDEVTRPLDVFPELVWKNIFTKIKNPNDIQNVCTASSYFDLLMTENGKKGQAQFGMVYPLIRPYLGPEIELLTRDFTRNAPNVFFENTLSFKEPLDKGVLGKIRKVCPYWRKIVWNDALQKLNMKYTVIPYPPDIPRRPGFRRFLVLSPTADQPFLRLLSIESAWHTARFMIPQVRQAEEMCNELNRRND